VFAFSGPDAPVWKDERQWVRISTFFFDAVPHSFFHTQTPMNASKPKCHIDGPNTYFVIDILQIKWYPPVPVIIEEEFDTA
jgi:hypothetical protein